MFTVSMEGLDLTFLLNTLSISAYDFHKILGIYVATSCKSSAESKRLFQRIEASIILKLSWETPKNGVDSPLTIQILASLEKKTWPVSALSMEAINEISLVTQQQPPPQQPQPSSSDDSAGKS
jgi:hypothetical protein